jgi:hypothetical protein
MANPLYMESDAVLSRNIRDGMLEFDSPYQEPNMGPMVDAGYATVLAAGEEDEA